MLPVEKAADMVLPATSRPPPVAELYPRPGGGESSLFKSRRSLGIPAADVKIPAMNKFSIILAVVAVVLIGIAVVMKLKRK
ncbi:MAG: hypothetical protein ABR964_15835 [Tepidisphaeraceae bacterium]